MIKSATRIALAALYLVTGAAHLIIPEPFLTITPSWVPWPQQVVLGTGLAEIAGALALVQTRSFRLRQAAGLGLALYALCVWPANINHMMMDLAREDSGLGLAYHVPRMIAQPILIGLALWVGELWPRRA